MRLIDADALKKYMGCADAVKYGNKTTEQQHNSYSTLMLYEIADYIDDAPTIEAEPVRHEESTSFITTDDIDKYRSRIILDEHKSKSCRVYYEDDREHGRWIDRGDYVTTAYGSLDIKVCSCCDSEITIDHFDDYCPNCGAKMDGGGP